MRDLWRQLDAWLQENAPEAFPALNAPATAEEILATEAAIGLRFPPSVEETFLMHDCEAADSPGIFEGWQLLPLNRVKEHWEEFVQLVREHGSQHFGEGAFDAAASIPVMWCESQIRYVQVEKDMAEGVLFELPRHGPPIRLADSWKAFLGEQLRRIESGDLVTEPDFGFELVQAGESASGA